MHRRHPANPGKVVLWLLVGLFVLGALAGP